MLEKKEFVKVGVRWELKNYCKKNCLKIHRGGGKAHKDPMGGTGESTIRNGISNRPLKNGLRPYKEKPGGGTMCPH